MLYRIAIPDNDPDKLGVCKHAAIKLFGAYTLTATCEGYWANPKGKVYVDPVRFFEVQTGGDPEGTIGYRVRLFADMARELFGEECIFVQRQSESFADLHWDEKITAVQHERE